MDRIGDDFYKSIESVTEHTTIFDYLKLYVPLAVPPANPFIPNTASLSHCSLGSAIGQATCFLLIADEVR
jgi:hypothetical protein